MQIINQLLVLALFAGIPRAGTQLHAQNFEKEVATVAEAISAAIVRAGKKKVTVLDFTDLQGNPNELGRFLSEQVSVDLITVKKNFEVVDRANLKSILAEHKLTLSGLINPEDTKKLGQFSGLDAIIFGSITPLKDDVVLTLKIVATDTVVLVGGTRGRIAKTKEIEQLLERGIDTAEPATGGSGSSTGSAKDYQGRTKFQDFDNLSVELDSFQTTATGTIVVTVVLKNKSKNEIGVGLNRNNSGLFCRLSDNLGWEYMSHPGQSTGIMALSSYGGDASSYESLRRGSGDVENTMPIGAGKAIKATLKFHPESRGQKAFGSEFKLQMEVIVLKQMNTPKPAAELNNVFIERIKPAEIAPR